jgi:hypothetical protein
MSACTKPECDQVLAMQGKRDGHGSKVYERQPPPPAVLDIIADVSNRTSIPVDAILYPPRLHGRGKFCQGHEHTHARWLAIYAVRARTGATYARIGSWFGQRSGSIVAAYRKGKSLAVSARVSARPYLESRVCSGPCQRTATLRGQHERGKTLPRGAGVNFTIL